MNNIIDLTWTQSQISNEFLDRNYRIMDTCNTISFNSNVLIDISIYFIINKTYPNPTIKIIYNNVEFIASTSSDFNLIFIRSELSIENVAKIPISLSTKMSLVCSNNSGNQIFPSNTITKLLPNWSKIDNINDELYQIDYNNNNYKYVGLFDIATFININLQISFTIKWINENQNQVIKLNLVRVGDNSIIRTLDFRKTRGGNVIEFQLINANFLTFLKGEDDSFNVDGFYFSLDTLLSSNVEININDPTYRFVIFNDKIR
jgi:hypothetical protein